jgi:hypothetical protein
MATRNPVDDEEQNDGNDKRPCRACSRSSQLIAHLYPVSGPPATLVEVAYTVHGGHVGCSEEPGHDVTDEAADAVDGEDVEALVDAEEVFVADCEEGCARGKGPD